MRSNVPWRGASACLLLLMVTLFLLGARPARATEKLLFCNNPERITAGGAYADARLAAGQTYRIFFHYRNGTRTTAPLVVALRSASRSFQMTVQKGIADPQKDPSDAGMQAMARFLAAPPKPYAVKTGIARFPITLRRNDVASGVLTVRADRDVRLRIYFEHDRRTVPGARVIALDAPRRELTVTLSRGSGARRYFRIGTPEPGMSQHLDGTYGLVYSFTVNAPEGSKVRIAFSPRGGKSGLVGTVNGAMHQSAIVEPSSWLAFAEAVVGKDGLVVTTLPFGGVFYPVELVFQLV